MNKIIYYYQTFTDLSPILNKNIVTHIHLSAIHFGVNNMPYIHLNNYSPNNKIFDSVWKQLQMAHNSNIKIILMIGGAGGAFTNLFNDFNTYYPLLKKTLESYSIISGVDLDIEEFVDINNVKMLINQIKKDFPKFTISMAPVQYALQTNNSGMGGFVYKDLYNSLEGKYIEYFNGQFYNDYTFDAFDDCVNNGYPSNKIVMGMITGQDFNNNLKELQKIKAKYPNFGGVFIWEYYNAPPDGEKDPSEWCIEISKILNIYS